MTTQTYYAAYLGEAIYGIGRTREEAIAHADEWVLNHGRHPDDVLAEMYIEPITKALYDHVVDFGGGSVPTERIAGGLLDYDPYYYC
jgi:hypothetical protein